MGQRGPVEQFPYLVKAYLDGAGLEKLDALPGKSRSQKVRDLIERAQRPLTWGERISQMEAQRALDKETVERRLAEQ